MGRTQSGWRRCGHATRSLSRPGGRDARFYGCQVPGPAGPCSPTWLQQSPPLSSFMESSCGEDKDWGEPRSKMVQEVPQRGLWQLQCYYEHRNNLSQGKDEKQKKVVYRLLVENIVKYCKYCNIFKQPLGGRWVDHDYLNELIRFIRKKFCAWLSFCQNPWLKQDYIVYQLLFNLWMCSHILSLSIIESYFEVRVSCVWGCEVLLWKVTSHYKIIHIHPCRWFLNRLSQLTVGIRQDTSWTGCQFITRLNCITKLTMSWQFVVIFRA